MDAIQLFHQMQQEGMLPDKVTYISILDAFTRMAMLAEGRLMHARLVGSEFELDVVVDTVLVNMYGECCHLQDATLIFENMLEQIVVTWNSMIAGYAQHGQGKAALQLFEQMQRARVMPNKITFVSILDACASIPDLVEGKKMHECVVDCGLELDVGLGTALLNMYGKCGSLEDAQRIFDKVDERIVVLWNAMIAAYARKGEHMDAFQLFEHMQKEGVMPNSVTFLSILPACASKATLAKVKRLHAHIVSSGFDSNVVVYNALLGMYAKCGGVENALSTFDEMPKLDKVTIISILYACASQPALAKGRQVHEHIAFCGLESDIVVGTALVSMYGKCGSFYDARRVFDTMPERNLISWGAMIAAYAQHGQGIDALQVFAQMQQAGVRPNNVTFVNLLTACSHAGLLNEARCCFDSMSSIHGLTPNLDHFNCIVDVLGRVGRLREAEALIYDMPFPPTSVTWMILLGACRNLVDVERGEHAAERVFQLDPANIAPYSMLSNIYALARGS